MRLACREPFEADHLLGFLAARAVPGTESIGDDDYRRSLRLAKGNGRVREGRRWKRDMHADPRRLADVQAAVQRVRRMLDLDSDPAAIDDHLGGDPLLAPLVCPAPRPALSRSCRRNRAAVRAVLGQQVSVAGARTLAARLVTQHGEALASPVDEITHVFPSAEMIAGLTPADFAMPRSRGAALIEACARIADGSIVLDAGSDRAETVQALQAVRGIGPWTAGYVAMRALGDPDVFLPTDVGVRNALTSLGVDGSPRAAEALAERWRPWRSYAQHHLWAHL